MEIDRNGLQVLDRDECLALMGTATIGRVSVSANALPTILPVNFWFDGDRIVIRSGAGAKLAAALDEAVVAFEVDDFDPVSHAGWSVVVTGVANAITDPDEVRALESAPLRRWAPSGDDRFVSISTELVAGRRLGEIRRPPRR